MHTVSFDHPTGLTLPTLPSPLLDANRCIKRKPIFGFGDYPDKALITSAYWDSRGIGVFISSFVSCFIAVELY